MSDASQDWDKGTFVLFPGEHEKVAEKLSKGAISAGAATAGAGDIGPLENSISEFLGIQSSETLGFSAPAYMTIRQAGSSFAVRDREPGRVNVLPGDELF